MPGTRNEMTYASLTSTRWLSLAVALAVSSFREIAMPVVG
jgi:hypothetical protein